VQNVYTNRTLKLNTSSTFENLVGGSGDDTLAGNSLRNTLIGGHGNDQLNGGTGGGNIFGGNGNDTYFFGPALPGDADQVHEQVNEGLDTLNFSAQTLDVVVRLGPTLTSLELPCPETRIRFTKKLARELIH
jgi:Ca2+-binding RTX toxin-like protein